ncbi:DUF3054 domain-containing protein [Agromyces lapidis]|uniref:DUF3054 domain-containing protein n=1 Tax=Agromyces lapidis TaxID=279574 RepID=A0ABV5SNH7_9MICO|nr:DUF3054 domain-containing protein [Agromyces lapidis]
MNRQNTPSQAAGAVGAFFVDAVLVVLFVMIGRRSHGESVDLAGVVHTGWPFLVALVVGWLVSLAWRRPLAIWPTGVVVWAVTVAGGLGLRVLTGEGAAIAFVIVATVTLALFLLGWRAIEGFRVRRRAARAAAEAEANGASAAP